MKENPTYTQLTRETRYLIARLHAEKIRLTEIARLAGIDKSTPGREIKRNSVNGIYCPETAHRLAESRRKGRSRIPPEVREEAVGLLRRDQSPEQISLSLKRKYARTVISHVTLYADIEKDKTQGGDLHRHLRRKRPYRKKKGKGAPQIKGRVSISQRPKIVEKRKRIGDWEADTVVGKNGRQSILTVVDRTSRYTLMAKLDYKSASNGKAALCRLLKPFMRKGKRNKVRTITSDNGAEFFYHQAISEALEAKFYFADPYSPWQRGTNEHTNGLIRQYLPKGCDFDALDDETLRKIMDKLNHRPRKCLGMKTPHEVFFAEKCPVALRG